MQPSYQQRVIDEKSELDAKLSSLAYFIESKEFDKIDSLNQELLNQQAEIMFNYSQILEKRIKLF